MGDKFHPQYEAHPCGITFDKIKWFSINKNQYFLPLKKKKGFTKARLLTPCGKQPLCFTLLQGEQNISHPYVANKKFIYVLAINNLSVAL